MLNSFLQKIKDEINAFFVAPIYPFLQEDWVSKMWIFIALSYVPIINVIIARGWRRAYIHRLGWEYDSVLPFPKETWYFFLTGLLLWIARGVFLLVPVVVITYLGLDGLLDLWGDIVQLFKLSLSYFWEDTLTTDEFSRAILSFTVNELIDSFLAFLIENIWLIVYVPVYRIGMIRYSLTGHPLSSHLAVVKNMKFLFRNFIDIVLMYAFNLFNFILILVVDSILTATIIGIPLIPIVTFYMYYWNSGYEYGLLARLMVEQENMDPTELGIVTDETVPSRVVAI